MKCLLEEAAIKPYACVSKPYQKARWCYTEEDIAKLLQFAGKKIAEAVNNAQDYPSQDPDELEAIVNKVLGIEK